MGWRFPAFGLTALVLARSEDIEISARTAVSDIQGSTHKRAGLGGLLERRFS